MTIFLTKPVKRRNHRNGSVVVIIGFPYRKKIRNYNGSNTVIGLYENPREWGVARARVLRRKGSGYVLKLLPGEPFPFPKRLLSSWSTRGNLWIDATSAHLYSQSEYAVLTRGVKKNNVIIKQWREVTRIHFVVGSHYDLPVPMKKVSNSSAFQPASPTTRETNMRTVNNNAQSLELIEITTSNCRSYTEELLQLTVDTVRQKRSSDRFDVVRASLFLYHLSATVRYSWLVAWARPAYWYHRRALVHLGHVDEIWKHALEMGWSDALGTLEKDLEET
jgi:hypothetical protein